MACVIVREWQGLCKSASGRDYVRDLCKNAGMEGLL